jgi:hypothetical protein
MVMKGMPKIQSSGHMAGCMLCTLGLTMDRVHQSLLGVSGHMVMVTYKCVGVKT